MYQHLQKNEGVHHSASFTIGAEASDVINAAIQLLDERGQDLANRAVCLVYLSSDANGDVIEAASGTLSIALGTDGMIIELATDNCFLMLCEADGDIDIDITQSSGADTHYLNVVNLANGKKTTSSAITFAA